MGKIIAVAVPKGGVGKTTTAVNLAASLAVAEKKTLLVDIDPSGACSISLGFTEDKIHGDIFKVFSFNKSLQQVIHKTDLENLDFIPSSVDTFENELRLTKLAENKTILRTSIRLEIYNYDYIIIDCPPYLHGMTTNALLAVDSVLLPTRAGSYSLKAVKKILNHIQWIRQTGNRDLKIEGILLTMYEANTKAAKIALEKLKELYPDHLLNTIIPKNTAINEATFKGKPVVLFNATASGSIAYMQLAKEILIKNIQI